MRKEWDKVGLEQRRHDRRADHHYYSPKDYHHGRHNYDHNARSELTIHLDLS